ncbi:MAG: phytanoyl-CoA dioxygenase family protein [Pseudomonadota bacterium]
MTRSLASEFESSGRVWLRNAVSEEDLKLFDDASTVSTKAGQRLEVSKRLKAALSEDSSLIRAVRRLSPNVVPVRVIAFNKSESANWGVPWHQDRVIAVSEKAEIAGYNNWTMKSGTWHCEPPLSILDGMLFVRIHLDDNDQSNGAMEIAVGSHSNGFVPSAEADSVAKTFPIETCEAKRGDVLILKMLTLHSSKPAQIQTGRRVFRIDFSSTQLPPPLAWNA